MIGVSDLKSVPFTLVSWGADQLSYTKVDGRLRLESDQLIIEWHEIEMLEAETGEKYDQVGERSSQLSIPLVDLESALVRRGALWGLLGGVLHLEVKRMSLLVDLPGQAGGRVKLKIARRDVNAATELVSRALLIRSELRLSNVLQESAESSAYEASLQIPHERPKTLLT